VPGLQPGLEVTKKVFVNAAKDVSIIWRKNKNLLFVEGGEGRFVDISVVIQAKRLML
jgi:hypothetical protein